MNSLDNLKIMLDTVNASKLNVILGTDQNMDYLKIGTQKQTMDLLNLVLEKGVMPVRTKPIRFTHSSST